MPTVRFICFIQKNFSTNLIKSAIQGVPHLGGFHYPGSHHNGFWLMYAQVGDFCVSRESPTLPPMQILCIVVFFSSTKIGIRWGPYFAAMPCLALTICVCVYERKLCQWGCCIIKHCTLLFSNIEQILKSKVAIK